MDGPSSVPKGERLPLSLQEQVHSVPAALPTVTRDSAPQEIWAHLEGFVVMKQANPVQSDRGLSPQEVLCVEFFQGQTETMNNLHLYFGSGTPGSR